MHPLRPLLVQRCGPKYQEQDRTAKESLTGHPVHTQPIPNKSPERSNLAYERILQVVTPNQHEQPNGGKLRAVQSARQARPLSCATRQDTLNFDIRIKPTATFQRQHEHHIICAKSRLSVCKLAGEIQHQAAPLGNSWSFANF
ncbi:predicted protein [Histoplasma capsulatum H143]|uniref:Uncharacterized protein n=1 Tax=Ajellomyces capsulatus (strain H143) TaxID=544712 RepID=C6HF35_AJECH|nr:predicted protein [Histoplasma capsulatum H143]